MANLQNIVLGIEGMECDACTQSVERAVASLKGVREVRVSLEEANAHVEFDSTCIDEERIHQAILDLGFDFPS